MLELDEYLKNTGKKWWGRKLINDTIGIFLDEKYGKDVELKEKLILYSLNYESKPICKVCGSDVKRHGFDYYETCSSICREELKKHNGELSRIQSKTKNTMIELYGVENPQQNNEVVEKEDLELCENKVVVEKAVSDKSLERIKRDVNENLNVKGRKTVKDKYGVDNISQTVEYKEKRKQGSIDTYQNISSDTIEILDLVEPNNDIKEIYETPSKRFHFRCKICNNEEVIPKETFKYRSLNYPSACAKCNNISTISVSENDVEKFLLQINNNIKTIRNTREIIPPYELDIYLPDLNIAIEYCGLYWHSEYKCEQNYHFIKYKKCYDKDIRLIQIFEDEWINKKNIVKNFLKNMIEPIKYIGARKTNIKLIAYNEYSKFLDENHILGGTNSSVRLGLYYNNELVSVMGFKKRNNLNSWELSRFCSSIPVYGAASKLLKYFEINYTPEEIISFADLRWSHGDLYNKLNFTFDSYIKPNYWYVKNEERIHRFNLRKDNSLPGTEIEQNLQKGYIRIFDAGLIKFIKKYT